MKTVILVLFVSLAVSEALKCYCGGMRKCSGPVETCTGSDNVCAKVTFTEIYNRYSKGCMKSRECKQQSLPRISVTYCCRRNLCNK